MISVDYQVGNLVARDINETFTKKKLAVLVPYRDAFDELLLFAPHMMKFLNEQKIPHHIYVVNQVDQFRFNRAALMNVGYLYIKDKFDYLVIHDIDLLPMNKNLSYECPDDGVLHLCPQPLHPAESSKNYLGGILIISNSDFESVNGMSNNFWGWGYEDDEFRENLLKHKVKINRPENIDTGKSTFHDIHNTMRLRDDRNCNNISPQSIFHRTDNDGLINTKVNITEVIELLISETEVTVLDVMLECDRNLTPSCLCD